MSKICNGLIKEDYEYHLSGDCFEFCHCVITNERCPGIIVEDPENRLSQFFSRAKNVPDNSRLNKCPLFGSSAGLIKQIAKERILREAEERINSIG